MNWSEWDKEVLSGNFFYRHIIDKGNFEDFKYICDGRYNLYEALNSIYSYCCFRNKKQYLIWLEEKKKVKPNYSGVDNAVAGVHLDLVKWFHTRGIKGFNSFFISVMNNNIVMMDYLYLEGYRHNQEECLDYVRKKEFKEAYKWMIRMGFSYEHEL